MRRLHILSAATGMAVVVIIAVAGPAAAGPDVTGEGDGPVFDMAARDAADAERAWQAAGEDPAARLVEYMRSADCAAILTRFGPRPCTEELAALLVPDCQGLEPVPPLWSRTRPSATEPWGDWDRISEWSCPWDTLPPITEEEFRRLPITPSVLTVQPDRPDVFVNMPTIVYTDPAVQTFTTTLLGYPIEVEATPTRFTWDFGDDSDPIVTTSPGHPYPDHDIAYPYPREGTFTITLTTEFTGRFRIAGTTAWHPVTGTATTATTAGPLTPVEHHTHLVDSNCIENPHGPWCEDD